MQTTAIRTVAKSLPQNKVILLTCLISNSYIPYTDLHKKLDFYASQIKIKSTPVRYIYNRASKLIKNYAYGQCMWT